MTPTGVAERFSDWFSAEFAALAELTDVVAAEIAARARGHRPHLADLRELATLYPEFILRSETVAAAGALFAPASVAGADRLLEWWERSDGTIAKVNFNLLPNTTSYYDYELREYFVLPTAHGRRNIHGPFVDFLGLDEYIITLTLPLTVDSERIGVSGADYRCRDLDLHMLPILRSLGAPAVLRNSDSRVIVGTSAEYLVGERMITVPTDARVYGVPVFDRHLDLVVLTD
ncbi:hypothetical protein [Brevibacterium luteolum]|uniref:Uncharacterized protein n=1 Tax=Brevibacterium luteolum TaxID=199591 RepID=A0A849ARD9_9MICO|nr:hypothetical protein [Brevibacterium luteolum]MBM7529729.1 hypothetical protein [Brevibacterium luteolum]NNG78490.1 hypothetical protein [Brevibacterium luteolum]